MCCSCYINDLYLKGLWILSEIDSRKLSVDELFARRKKIVRLYESGLPVMKIVREIGLGWDAVNTAIKLFEKGGKGALKPKSRGRKQGTRRLLKPAQEDALCEVLYNKKPYQVGLKDSKKDFKLRLWTRSLVKQHVKNVYGISLSSACLSLYLDRWGLRINSPSLDPKERCAEEIQNWLRENNCENEYEPQYRYWIVRHTIDTQKSRSPLQKKNKQRYTVATAISGNGEHFWAVYKGNFTKDRQVGFLNFLLLQTYRKILIIRSTGEHFTHLKINRFVHRHQQRIRIVPPLLPNEQEILINQQEIIAEVKAEREGEH